MRATDMILPTSPPPMDFPVPNRVTTPLAGTHRWVCRISFAVGFLAMLVIGSSRLAAQPPSSSPKPPPNTSPQSRLNTLLRHGSSRDIPRTEVPNGLQRLATAIVLDNLPEQYVDDDDWGETRQRWDGLHMRLDGLEVRTKRRWKTVNHGTWKRLEITQIDPQQNFHVRLGVPQSQPDGRTTFDLSLKSKVNTIARLVQWNRGVRLLSVTLDADAEVEITAQCCLDIQMDPTRFPPDLILKPEVTGANVRLKHVRINRISHFDGPVVRELSSGLKRLLREKIDEKRPQMVTKINRQIKRHEDDLRFSMNDTWQTYWTKDQSTDASTAVPSKAGSAAGL